MKKINLLIITITMSCLVHAQQLLNSPEITWDKPTEKFDDGFISDIKLLKADSENIYLNLSSAKIALFGLSYNRFIVKYDRKNGNYETISLTEKSDKKLEYLGYVTIDNTLHKFSYFHNKKDMKMYLFVQSFDYILLKANDDVKKIAEIDMSKKRTEIESTAIIYDNNRILFRYGCRSKEGQFFGMEVFNKKLEREWGTNSIAMTENGYNFENSYKIDNEGNVYAIQRNFEKEKDINTNYENSRVWVVCYPKSGGEPLSQLLMLKENRFIPAVQLSLNNNFDVVCAGFYSMPGTVSAVGAFSFVIEPMLVKIQSINYYDFPIDLINKGLSLKQADDNVSKIAKKKDFDSNFNFNLSKINYRSDGSFDLIGEKYYRVIKAVTNRNGTTYTIYNYYDDLWVLNFNANGSFKWVQKIPKFAYVINNYDNIGSYHVKYNKDDSYTFIFNLATSSEGFLKEGVQSKTICIQLDKNGNEKFNELISDSEVSSLFSPSNMLEMSDGSYLVTLTNFAQGNMLELGEVKLSKKYNYCTFGTLKTGNQ